MVDQYGRKIDYIRISVTDRCNLRCTYCMPEEGVEQIPHQDILRYDEIVRLCRICAGKGISKVKITGGEPLVRKGIWNLIREIHDLEGIEQVTVTTNGVLLKEQIHHLVEAGISAVNVSLDTLDPGMYEQITRRNELKKALDGIEEALKYPQIQVKINCVPLAGVNDNQWIPLAAMAKDRPLDVRFIEMMPIGLGRQYHGRLQDEIRKNLESAYGTSENLNGTFGNGPSTYIHFDGFEGKIGFISAISHKFCQECNRIRLTAEGFLKVCLQYSEGTDLREPLRNGRSDEEIGRLIEQIIYRKPGSHHFEEAQGDGFEQRQMSRIGG